MLRNLDYMRDKPIAEQMKIVVLGTGDDVHRRRLRSDPRALRRQPLRRSSATSSWIAPAGSTSASSPTRRISHLAGCDNIGSRPLQHLHITPRGQCVLCCEDYDENYIVGDLTRNTIAEVLEGPELAKMRAGSTASKRRRTTSCAATACSREPGDPAGWHHRSL